MTLRTFKRENYLFLVLLAALGAFVSARLGLGYGGVYTQTKHGDLISGVQREATLPRGNCNQCHVQHGSYDFGLFAANTNSLCYACHASASPLRIYQGQAAYNVSTHAASNRVVWPAPPPVRTAAEWGKCVNCHNPHGYKDATGLVPSMGWRREESLCKECHDGAPGKDVYGQFTKLSKHPVATYVNRHSAAEGGDSTKFGTANRHSECADCHNPHFAKADGIAPYPPNASSRIKGISRVAVGAGRSFIYYGPESTSDVKEYEVCYKCHSSWTTLPAGARDKAAEFNPANASFHPVEAAGKNTDIDSRTLVSPWTQSSLVYCTSCHTSDNTAIRGPHGSAYAPILKKAYFTGDNAATPATDVCFDCHVAAQYLTDTKRTNSTYTHFREGPGTGEPNFHYLHVVNVKTSCNTCHDNIHGSTTPHLITFSSVVTGSRSYVHTISGGYCSLTCHGKTHGTEESYRWR